jgi:hypothetical protein
MPSCFGDRNPKHATGVIVGAGRQYVQGAFIRRFLFPEELVTILLREVHVYNRVNLYRRTRFLSVLDVSTPRLFNL